MEKMPIPSIKKENSDSDQENKSASLNTEAYRKNKQAVEYHVAGNLEIFYENTNEALEQMFGVYPRLRIEDLEPEEREDIENFIQYVEKRLAVGAVSSKLFHKQVQAGSPLKALHVFNPGTAGEIGHDSIHAMFAYAESKGTSLVPAYMKVDPESVITDRGVSMDDRANLEENYVAAFAGRTLFLEPICKELIEQGVSGEELVQSLIKRWDVEIAQRTTSSLNNVRNPDYIKENVLPEFVTMVRNYCQQMEKGNVNPKFSLNEFRRILRPLLDRLKQKQEIAGDISDLGEMDSSMSESGDEEKKAQEILSRIKEL